MSQPPALPAASSPFGSARFSPALVTDLYELTMLQAYVAAGMFDSAVFSLFVRRLPERRNYLVACGLEDVLTFLEQLRFDPAALAYLESLARFSPDFLHYLATFRFTGDVFAMPEGTPVFPPEPILEIRAPLPQAQFVESYVMNQVHLQTLLASKAVRVVDAAQGREVIDFGMRRMHGIDAAVKAARAFHIAGVTATSQVAGGQAYGMPVAGTMAHSYIQAHDDELEAFRAFAAVFPDTTLLVDTYDTLDGVRKVTQLARSLGDRFRVRAIRLDSGDLHALSVAARQILDDAGLSRVGIFGTGNLDEDEVARLIAAGAPIDSFGVGTEMGVSRDVPAIDIVYKLVEYGGKGRIKLAANKLVLPGRKQVFRVEREGVAHHDVLARHDEASEGRPLLQPVMVNGRRVPAGRVALDAARAYAAAERTRLPAVLRRLEPAEPPYPVEIGVALAHDTDDLRQRHQRDR